MKSIVLSISLLLFSFLQKEDKKLVEFSYPQRDHTTISLKTDVFANFSKEWRGGDYYYVSESEKGFVCSVLYYQLNQHEQLSLVEAPKVAIGGPEKSPAYPFAYFSTHSNLKSLEQNNTSWGKPSDEFMFRQNDVSIPGTSFGQKHMYGYGMVDKDLFVNIHLSKTSCTADDSTLLRQMLSSLVIKK